MNKIEKKQMYEVKGGAVNYALLNAIARAASAIFTVGQAIGSAVRRMTSKNYC